MPEVKDSILDSTKKILGIYPSDTNFDTDIIIHINSVFAMLEQLGVGPEDGFQIEDNTTTWSEYLGGNKLINNVKTLMGLQVRLWFDPPTTSFDLTAKKEQIQELQWRINVAVDRGLTLFDGTIVPGGVYIWVLEEYGIFPSNAKKGDLGVFTPTKQLFRNE